MTIFERCVVLPSSGGLSLSVLPAGGAVVRYRLNGAAFIYVTPVKCH